MCSSDLAPFRGDGLGPFGDDAAVPPPPGPSRAAARLPALDSITALETDRLHPDEGPFLHAPLRPVRASELGGRHQGRDVVRGVAPGARPGLRLRQRRRVAAGVSGPM